MKLVWCLLLIISVEIFANRSSETPDAFSEPRKLYQERELEASEKPILVSLGANCIPAYHALIQKIRSASYPFDWTIADLKSIIINLKEDFLHFVDDKYCTLRDNWILNSYDDLKFPHEFQTLGEKRQGETPDLKFLPVIKEKYQRRIKRFRQLLSHKNVIFMRYASLPADMVNTKEDKETAVFLRDALRNYLKREDFLLIMLGNEDYYKTNWNIEGIKNYYIATPWYDIKAESMKQELIPIFKELNLIV